MKRALVLLAQGLGLIAGTYSGVLLLVLPKRRSEFAAKQKAAAAGKVRTESAAALAAQHEQDVLAALRTSVQQLSLDLEAERTRARQIVQEVAAVKEENAHLNLEVAKAEQRCAHAEGKTAAATARLAESEAHIQQLERVAEELEKKLEEATRPVAYKVAKIEQAIAQELLEAAAKAQLAQSTDKVALQSQLADLTSQLASLTTENTALKAENEEMAIVQQENEQLVLEVAKAEKRCANAEGKAAEITAQLLESDAYIRQLETEAGHGELEKKVFDVTRSLSYKAAELEQATQRETAAKALSTEKVALQSERAELTSQVTALTAENAALHTQEAQVLRQLENAELEIAGLKAQLNALEVSAIATIVHHDDHISPQNSALVNEAELLQQELEEAKAFCAKLDEENEHFAKAYAEATMAAQAAQAETAEARAWMQQADEELQEQERIIRNLQETIHRISQTTPASSDPERPVPQAEAQAIVGLDATATLQKGPELMAHLIDGGTAAEFSSDPKWSKLREEGAAAGWLLRPNEIVRGKEIGKGTFGTAFEATWRGVRAVVKCVKVRHANPVEETKRMISFLREVETPSHLRHPHILPFFGACMRSIEQCWLITEFLPGGDLSQWIHGDGARIPKRGLEERLKMALDVAKGMRAMHESQPPIVHRDLKPSNVFIDAKGNARVADMGLARHLRPGDEAYLTGSTGTYQYMAPEMIGGGVYDQTVDIYSFGIMLWEIAAQHRPYEDAKLKAIEVARAVVDDDSFRPSLKLLPKNVPSAIGIICQRCWDSYAELRPSFAELVKTLEDVQREQAARSSTQHGRKPLVDLN